VVAFFLSWPTCDHAYGASDAMSHHVIQHSTSFELWGDNSCLWIEYSKAYLRRWGLCLYVDLFRGGLWEPLYEEQGESPHLYVIMHRSLF
jgi:hypothetical protein